MFINNIYYDLERTIHLINISLSRLCIYVVEAHNKITSNKMATTNQMKQIPINQILLGKLLNPGIYNITSGNSFYDSAIKFNTSAITNDTSAIVFNRAACSKNEFANTNDLSAIENDTCAIANDDFAIDFNHSACSKNDFSNANCGFANGKNDFAHANHKSACAKDGFVSIIQQTFSYNLKTQ